MDIKKFEKINKFSSAIVFFIALTTYYLRAYAKNANGIGYGNVISSPLSIGSQYQGGTVFYLDGNGVVDVVADTMRLRGTDGLLLNWFPVPSAIEFRIPAAVSYTHLTLPTKRIV